MPTAASTASSTLPIGSALPVGSALCSIVKRRGFGGVAGYEANAFQHRAHFGQRGQGATRSLRKLEALLLPEQPVNKAIQLLAPDQQDAWRGPPCRRLAERARKTRVDVRLVVFPELQHVFHFSAGHAPEADEAIRKLAEWVRPKLGFA
jgi:hypothetical protein